MKKTDEESLSHRILGIAVPMILSNLTIPLLGVVDTAVIGHLPKPAYLGAVAVGTSIFNFLFMGLNFLRMGTTGVTAQVHGRNEPEAMRATLGQSVMLALVLALLLLLLQDPLEKLALWLIHPNPGVATYTATYFEIRIWAAPAVLVNYSLLGWFLGMQNARVPMAMLILVSGTNIVLDIFFVLGLGMNVGGVALGTVFAEYLGAGFGFWRASRLLARYPGLWRPAALLARESIKRLLGINTNILIRTLSLMFAFGFFTAQGARFGNIILAANAILINFQSVMAYALDGFAHAAEALAGRAIGKNHYESFTQTVKICALWSLGLAIGFALLYALAGQKFVYLLTNLAPVRAAALTYLPWMILSPLISAWPFLLDGIFIGATRAREMRNSMLFSTFICYMGAWYLFRPLGNHGLWLAFMVFIAARALSMLAYYPHIRKRSFSFIAGT